jgi:hypothetical protein
MAAAMRGQACSGKLLQIGSTALGPRQRGPALPPDRVGPSCSCRLHPVLCRKTLRELRNAAGFRRESTKLKPVDGLIQAITEATPSICYGRVWSICHRMPRFILLLITIIALPCGYQHLYAQDVPSETPPRATLPEAPTPQADALAALPRATPLPPEKAPDHAILQSDTQTKQDDTYTLTGDVEIDYRDHVLRADRITYNSETGEVQAEGHVRLTGGVNDETIEASHGSYNIRTQTGTFYDVSGSVQARGLTDSLGANDASAVNTNVVGVAGATRRQDYLNTNPFLFRGRKVVKTGPQDYVVYDGSVTSCLLPNPDWQLVGKRFVLSDGKAHAGNSTFKLLGIPVLFLPFVTHPVDTYTAPVRHSDSRARLLQRQPEHRLQGHSPSASRRTSRWAALPTSPSARSTTRCAASVRTAPSAIAAPATTS